MELRTLLQDTIIPHIYAPRGLLLRISRWVTSLQAHLRM